MVFGDVAPRGGNEVAFPCRKAADVDVVPVQPRAVTILGELKLKFELVALDRAITNHTVSAHARPSPHAVWAAVG